MSFALRKEMHFLETGMFQRIEVTQYRNKFQSDCTLCQIDTDLFNAQLAAKCIDMSLDDNAFVYCDLCRVCTCANLYPVFIYIWVAPPLVGFVHISTKCEYMRCRFTFYSIFMYILNSFSDILI